ncbi:hypothetical protein Plec18167_001745 [Paecilomyces lecythidis]|uniref:ATP-grasp domain-containing protein n=1 Tax=Paecilomyces lecythidis TaxID=3004212 RepID=A0ABR3YBA3_9EURO
MAHSGRRRGSTRTSTATSSSSRPPVVAVLFQDIDPPVINGVRKPRKPGGYQDSGADIAYTLRQRGLSVLTPQSNPDPFVQEGWCFSDTTSGILDALQRGATHLWANTILFASHPLQTASELDPWESRVYVVGQPPSLVENFDDKAYLNGKLRDIGGFTLPRSWLVKQDKAGSDGLDTVLGSIPRYPIVGKPIRGRGSHGVKVCRDESQLREHVLSLLEESPVVMLEEFLAGEEATVTVMPPSAETPRYWSLQPVARFSHQDGIAPYNGAVAVTQNSRVVGEDEMEKDRSYRTVMEECERVAEVIKATAPIRIDVRRFGDGEAFAIFDINMKPNMTGPGRPGRENQASLTAIAAEAIGWDYGTLLENILRSSQTLGTFRRYRSPF